MQMFHSYAQLLRHGLRDDAAVTVLGIRLETENAYATIRADKIHERDQLFLRRIRREMLEKDLPHLGVTTSACGRATVSWSAKGPQMQVIDTDRCKVPGER